MSLETIKRILWIIKLNILKRIAISLKTQHLSYLKTFNFNNKINSISSLSQLHFKLDTFLFKDKQTAKKDEFDNKFIRDAGPRHTKY